MNFKKGDSVFLSDSGSTKTAVVVKDGLDSKGRVRVRPSGYPFDISITTEVNDRLYVKTS